MSFPLYAGENIHHKLKIRVINRLYYLCGLQVLIKLFEVWLRSPEHLTFLFPLYPLNSLKASIAYLSVCSFDSSLQYCPRILPILIFASRAEAKSMISLVALWLPSTPLLGSVWLNPNCPNISQYIHLLASLFLSASFLTKSQSSSEGLMSSTQHRLA